jgi:Tol biopolymer transport system component
MRRRVIAAQTIPLGVPLLSLLVAGAATGQQHFIERVSVANDGVQANGRSWIPSINADGNRVCFLSNATNLVAGDTNACEDVFVRDRQLAQTIRASLSWTNQEPATPTDLPTISGDGMHVVFEPGGTNFTEEDPSGCPSIVVRDLDVSEIHAINLDSAGNPHVTFCGSRPPINHGGRYVVFDSLGWSFVPDDTNLADDAFLRDRVAGTTERVSISSEEQQGDGASGGPSVSADGRYVAFLSLATNLVPGDTNATWDVFVRDRLLGLTERVSVSSSGAQGDGRYWSTYISPDGRYVAFDSGSTNLVPDDTNGKADVFLHDRVAHTTVRVSVDSSGNQADGDSYRPAVSADGRFVAFESAATNLVPDDTNGLYDVFVHDTQTGQTIRVSLTYTGAEANGHSWFACIAADAPHCVAFCSSATNLVAGDDNGQDDVFVAFHGPLAVRWPRDQASLLPADGGRGDGRLLASGIGWPSVCSRALRLIWAALMDVFVVAC